MTGRGVALCTALAFCFLCAFSFGKTIYYYPAFLLLIVLVYSLISTFAIWKTSCLTCSIQHEKNVKGEANELSLRYQHKSLFLCAVPVIDIQIKSKEQEILFPGKAFKIQQKTINLDTEHIGCFNVTYAIGRFQDLFGVFLFSKKFIQKDSLQYLVLPKPYLIEELHVEPGEDGKALPHLSQEDYNAPEDIRTFIPGDAMKRVHWKLSSRKRELLVRKFEVPAPADTLVLLDCSPNPNHDADIQDTLCETVMAVAAMQIQAGVPVRVPFYGKQPTEFDSDNAQKLSVLQELLALQRFDNEDHFSTILRLELSRMRRIGATVVIASHLDAQVAEGVRFIRSQGSSVRFYYVSKSDDHSDVEPFVHQLLHYCVEVCYVKPA